MGPGSCFTVKRMNKHENDERVWVYQYKYWHEASRTFKVAEMFATLDAIRNGLGVPVFTNARQVSMSDIVGGIYHAILPKTPR